MYNYSYYDKITQTKSYYEEYLANVDDMTKQIAIYNFEKAIPEMFEKLEKLFPQHEKAIK